MFHLNFFLPKNKTSPPGVGHRKLQQSTYIWLSCFFVLCAVKIYYALPIQASVGGAPAYAEEKPAENTDKLSNPINIGVNEVQILHKLKEKHNELLAKEAEQKQKEAELNILNDIAKKNMEALTQIKNALEASKKGQGGVQTAMSKTAKMYEGMKPNQAAKIMEQMDTGLVAQIIGLMKKQVAAQVVAALSEAKARDVTMRALNAKP